MDISTLLDLQKQGYAFVLMEHDKNGVPIYAAIKLNSPLGTKSEDKAKFDEPTCKINQNALTEEY